MNIKKGENIITYEIAVNFASTETPFQKTNKSPKEDVEDYQDDVNTVYMETQSMFNNINQFHYEAETAGSLNRYMSYQKGGSIGKGIQELQKAPISAIPKLRNQSREC